MDFRDKICGITNVDDALAAVDAGADAIGLNFYQRQSSGSFALAEMHDALPTRSRETERVGVFVNASADEIRQIGRDASIACTYPASRR